ncbi:DUF3515 domain-containing protein [Nocardiopsis composta]|uniref:DUF3515 domain-containing protein n=1 Tax=Nocardiopsis composta TaxID=157465 RepID=A0A7W8QQY0_9ACTN|nr:DUF3515 domain-containing protein [Nocardiopsis composta]MBB5434960.1 hypothetical protein [Nocardiopsis composta]
MRRRATTGASAAALLLLTGCTAGAVQVPLPSPAPEAERLCGELAGGLPDEIFGQRQVPTDPESDLVAAWGDPAIALRCGVERPESYRPDSELTVVNGVAWLPEPADRPTTYTALGREAYVEVTVPPSYSPPAEALVAVGDAVADTVPALPDGEL